VKAISHRLRLTLVAALSAGGVLLLIFVLAVFGLERSERSSAHEEVQAALSQVAGDYRSGEPTADLAEVVNANPELSLSVFDAEGKLVEHAGQLNLNRPTDEGSDPAVVSDKENVQGKVIVGAVRWNRHAELISRFEWLCALLWLPLIGVVGFATWRTARSTFRPLEILAAEAEALSAEDLSARLHVENSREYEGFVGSLNRLLERVETAFQREERFVEDAAHELRTPLTILQGQVEAVLLKDRTPEEYRETLRVLSEETTRLSTLVELLLRSAGPKEVGGAQADVAETIERAHARWVDRYSANQVRLDAHSETSSAAIGAVELSVVLDNLLSNALRVSPAGGSAGMTTTVRGDRVTLSVSDEGPGIDPEELERIFLRFARTDAGRSRSAGGFGIGLALCRRIVVAAGGRIWAEANSPKGTVFRVEIPRPEIPLSNR
jgi:signal transduction histidine kinase